MMLKCKHCNHEWDYQGIREYTACCPSCLYKVYINWNGEQLEVIRQLRKEIEERKGAI